MWLGGQLFSRITLQLRSLKDNFATKKFCHWFSGQTHFNDSKSGWFDYIFHDWFKNLALPILKRQVGKVIICRNLATHISECHRPLQRECH
jgi:hypothetical protein